MIWNVMNESGRFPLRSWLIMETVKDLFCNETGCQTPKLDTCSVGMM